METSKKITNTQRFIGFMSEQANNGFYTSINDLIFKHHFGHRIGGRICELRKKWGFEFSKYTMDGIDFWRLEKIPMYIEFDKKGKLRRIDEQKSLNFEEVIINKDFPEIDYSEIEFPIFTKDKRNFLNRFIDKIFGI